MTEIARASAAPPGAADPRRAHVGAAGRRRRPPRARPAHTDRPGHRRPVRLALPGRGDALRAAGDGPAGRAGGPGGRGTVRGRRMPELVSAMLGGRPEQPPRRARSLVDRPPPVVLSGVTAPGRLTDVTFTVRAGEVVGVAGLQGAGHRRRVGGGVRAYGGRRRTGGRRRAGSAALAAGRGARGCRLRAERPQTVRADGGPYGVGEHHGGRLAGARPGRDRPPPAPNSCAEPPS
ncbi:hypothetical protein ACRAWF_42290 [Streptomyces sp. L7]